MFRRSVLSIAGLLWVAGTAPTMGSNPVRTFLTASFDLSPEDISHVDAGHVVSRTLDASDPREVATIGLVRIRMTPPFYVERFGDIATFKRDEAVLQIGEFGRPPDLRDISGLTLDDKDIRSLRECRPGKCGVQLPADAIDRFRHEVNWQAADSEGQANQLMRRLLVDYVAAYFRGGAKASMQYADRPEPLHLGQEFVSLTASDAVRWPPLGGLHRHLVHYPLGEPAGTTDLVYWSKEQVGRRTVVSVTHLVISRTESEWPAQYTIASKQIYGSHYFDASLGLTILVRDDSTPSPATYLVYLNRSRVDVFGGMFGGLARKIVRAKARSKVADQLAQLRTTLEPAFASR